MFTRDDDGMVLSTVTRQVLEWFQGVSEMTPELHELVHGGEIEDGVLKPVELVDAMRRVVDDYEGSRPTEVPRKSSRR